MTNTNEDVPIFRHILIFIILFEILRRAKRQKCVQILLDHFLAVNDVDARWEIVE